MNDNFQTVSVSSPQKIRLQGVLAENAIVYQNHDENPPVIFRKAINSDSVSAC